MNKEKYLEMRNGLYNEAKNLINEGKIEEAKLETKIIRKNNILDEKFVSFDKSRRITCLINWILLLKNMRKCLLRFQTQK